MPSRLQQSRMSPQPSAGIWLNLKGAVPKGPLPFSFMRSIYHFKDAHKGQVCAVLGGGTSLPGDLRNIPKVDILIGVNQHSLILPLDYVAFMDRHMWDYVEGYKDILKITPLNKWPNRQDVIHAGEAPAIGFSGALAIWAADYMGFDKILICGMDQYQDKNGLEYWWQGPQTKLTSLHTSARDNTSRWREFIQSLQSKDRIYFVSGRLKEMHQ